MKKDRSNKISDEVFSELGKTKRSERQKRDTLERLKDAPEKKPIPYSYYISIVSAALIFLLLYLPTFLGTDIGADNEQEVEKQWVESEIFPLEDTPYHLIGIEGRVGFTVDYDGESSNIYANDPFEYDWYFWGDEEELTSSLKIEGTHESGEESYILLTNNGNPVRRWGYVAGFPQNGADSHLTISMEFPKPGYWELDVSVTNGFSEKIVVYAKERPEGEERVILVRDLWNIDVYQRANVGDVIQGLYNESYEVELENAVIATILSELQELPVHETDEDLIHLKLQDEMNYIRFEARDNYETAYLMFAFDKSGNVYIQSDESASKIYAGHIDKYLINDLLVPLLEEKREDKDRADKRLKESCPQWDNDRTYSFFVDAQSRVSIPCFEPVLDAESNIEIRTIDRRYGPELTYMEREEKTQSVVFALYLIEDANIFSGGTDSKTLTQGDDYEIIESFTPTVDEDGNPTERQIVARGIVDDVFDFHIIFYNQRDDHTQEEIVKKLIQVIEDIRR
ncbi:hypothetical protein ACERII_14870 [Evansella sp. AB-rgal1]|uniref:hypothetical protein n=1 Tax=Evansella sp. AB-rgal1 TaxID=3242696 RepID=UPI00359E2A8B